MLWIALTLLACEDGKLGLFNDTGGIFGGGGGGVNAELCDEPQDESAPAGPACVTDSIACGETLTGTTVGGSEVMSDALYTSAFCFVPFEDYDGPERVYALDLPADTLATITASFPCGDMGFAAMRWEDTGSCPNEGSGVVLCEGLQYGSGGSVTITPFDSDTRHLLVIDTPAGASGEFQLRVGCEAR